MMIDLAFGDVCICDISLSLNSPKDKRAPLIFLGKEVIEDKRVCRFCRVGGEPKSYAMTPFILFCGEPALRNDGAIYPTQYILFPEGIGVITFLGRIQNEETLQLIKVADEKNRKQKNVALVMNLCPRCRDDFMLNPETVVKRLDPCSPVRSTCDFCQVRQGHLFIVYKKRIYRNGVRK